MVEETKLVEATKEGEEVKVEILTKVILLFLMVVIPIWQCAESGGWPGHPPRGQRHHGGGSCLGPWGSHGTWRGLFSCFREMFHLFFDQVGLLAAVGVTEVKVAAAPSVAVLSTGGLLSFYLEILTDN